MVVLRCSITLAVFCFFALGQEICQDDTDRTLDVIAGTVLLQTGFGAAASKPARLSPTKSGAEDTQDWHQHHVCNQTKRTPSRAQEFTSGAEARGIYHGLYVNAEKQFAFCAIAKNACSNWNLLFQRLETHDLDTYSKSRYSESIYTNSDRAFTPAKAQNVFDSPHSVRAVFVRDPLERFLSAFLDKCTSLSCKNPLCYARSKNLYGKKLPFSSAVDWLRNLPHTNGEPVTAALNSHWNLQSRHCELNKRIHEYNFVLMMTSDSLAADATCLLERAGLSSLNVQNSTDSSPYWISADSSGAVSTTADHLKAFYTKEAAEVVYKAYEEDYHTFNLSRPSWIEDAHGRLYHSTGDQENECRVDRHDSAGDHSTLQLHQLDHGAGDKDAFDDVLSEARRAGFVL